MSASLSGNHKPARSGSSGTLATPSLDVRSHSNGKWTPSSSPIRSSKHLGRAAMHAQEIARVAEGNLSRDAIVQFEMHGSNPRPSKFAWSS